MLWNMYQVPTHIGRQEGTDKNNYTLVLHLWLQLIIAIMDNKSLGKVGKVTDKNHDARLSSVY